MRPHRYLLGRAQTVGSGVLETVVTPTLGQISFSGQHGHFGAGPVQMYLPNGSTSRLIDGR